jgi:hypothetical protein
LEQPIGSLYKTASWYNLMAVSYGAVGRHQAVAAFWNDTSINPMHGSKFDVHLGLGYHVAMAYTMLFNFLVAMHSTCEAVALEEELATNGGSSSPARSKPANGLYDEPLAKDRGAYGSSHAVRQEWERNVQERARSCQSSASASEGTSEAMSTWPNGTGLDPTSAPAATLAGRPIRPQANHSTPVCEYAWLANPQTRVFGAAKVTAALESVMTQNSGWVAIDGRQMGWHVYDNSSSSSSSSSNNNSNSNSNSNNNASSNVAGQVKKIGGAGVLSVNRFEIEIPNVTLPTKYFTVVSMKSYSKDWVGSKLKVTVDLIRSVQSQPTEPTSASDAKSPPPEVYEIAGYHEIRTSVFFPHKFALPGGGARVGDTIRARFELVGGTMFKIGGIAFCLR